MDINFTGHPSIEFEGICSGDGESFCWDVDKETYMKIKGWNEYSPSDCAEIGFDENGDIIAKSEIFRLYPSDIFGYSCTETKRRIKIEWEDIP